MKKGFLKRTVAMIAILSTTIVGVFNFSVFNSNAATTTIDIEGNKYTFDGKTNYVFSNSSGCVATTNDNTYGNFAIEGDVTSISSVDGFTAYKVSDGLVTVSYAIDQSKLNVGAEEWHIYSDSTKKVDDITLDRKVSRGTIILQASIDGQNWITETHKNDIFTDASLSTNFYTTSDIQQLNGCYYRVIVVYELERKIDA